MFFAVHSSQVLITAIHPPPPPFPTVITALIIANKIPALPHLLKPPDPPRKQEFILHASGVDSRLVSANSPGRKQMQASPEEESQLLCHLLRKDYAPPLSYGVSTGSNVAKTPSDVRLGMHCAL